MTARAAMEVGRAIKRKWVRVISCQSPETAHWVCERKEMVLRDRERESERDGVDEKLKNETDLIM